MCGLIVSFGERIDEKVFARLLSKMDHRGPDHRATKEDLPGVQLGHCRLSILGLNDDSNQPFLSRSGKKVILFNGEIYNFSELAHKHSINIPSGSDTELIVELFERLGPGMMGELIGMFAFVIVDTETGQYFVARDRLGVKPLYTYEGGGRLVFASEISPILELNNNLCFDDFAIRQYRALRGFFNGRTPYKGIEMFPAGTYQMGPVRTKYWHLTDEGLPPPLDEEVEELLYTAIRFRTISDVEVGAFLSGGVDSAFISSVANAGTTWSVGLREDNEFASALEASQEIGSNHHNLSVSPQEFLDTAREMIHIRKEPLAVPNEVLLFRLSAEAAAVNKVLLSGEGADELFLGYSRIFGWAANSFNFDIEEFAAHYCYERSDGDLELFQDAISPYLHFGSTLKIVKAFFQISHLQGLLRRLDNSTMLAGVEGRAPYTDHRLVERMFSTLPEYQFDGLNHKAQLRRIASKKLPKSIAYRSKVGFPVDFDKILGQEIRDPKKFSRPLGYSNWFDFNLRTLGYQEE